MQTGSRDEKVMLNDISRIAKALERIANALEQQVYGVTGAEVARLRDQLRQEFQQAQQQKER